MLFEKEENWAENVRQVSTIDFVDDEQHVGRCFFCFRYGLIKYAFLGFISQLLAI